MISFNQYTKLLKLIKPIDRITISHVKRIRFRPSTPQPGPLDYADTGKPKGIWYALGAEWLTYMKTMGWLEDEDLSDLSPEQQNYKNVFKLDLNTSKMLFISTMPELLSFTKIYGVPEPIATKQSLESGKFTNPLFHYAIDWRLVAAKYTGLEIPLIAEAHQLLWYLDWAVSSGCVWNKSAIKRMIKLPI